MKIEQRKLSDLRFCEYNPRTIKPEILEKIKKSILKFGFIQPLVINEHTCEKCGDRKNVVIGGNQRLKALLDLFGPEKIVDVVIVNLHLKEEKTLNIALNSLKGDWNFLKLDEILQELKTDSELFDLLGFEKDFEKIFKPFNFDELEYSQGEIKTKKSKFLEVRIYIPVSISDYQQILNEIEELCQKFNITKKVLK